MLDASGQKLAYVYFESEPGRRSAAKLLSDDEARRIAGEHCSAARLPETGMNVRVASSRHLPANLNLICAAAGWLANTRPPLATDSPEKPSMTDSATSTNPSAASLRLGSSRRRTPASLCWAIRAFEAMGHLPLEIGPKGTCLIQQLITIAALKPDLVGGDEQHGRNESLCD